MRLITFTLLILGLYSNGYGDCCNGCVTKRIELPTQLNIFGRFKRNIRISTQRSFDLITKVTPRVSFLKDEKQVIDKVRQYKQLNARLKEVSE
jgi:hypothetical protein